jgi:VanZ family protein
VFSCCVLIYALSSKSNPLPAAVGKYFSDWFLHGVEYGFLGFFLTGALRFSLKIKSFRVLMISTGVLGALYGATDEIHQLFVPFRCCDLRDWTADVVGSLCGAAVFWCVVKTGYKKKASVHAGNQSVSRASL